MGKIFSIIKQHRWLIAILVFFCLLYCLISLVNHYNFRTNAYDLGIYNNVLYDYSKFEINDNPVMHKEFDNILSDHFSLYHVFFAPFRFLLGSWTLLIFQILSILFGGIGIYRLMLWHTEKKIIANLAVFHFLSMWGIFSALSFDYHDNVVATMFVPWLLYSTLRENWKWTMIWTLVILISKENMSLWLFFIFTGTFLWKFKNKNIRNISVILGGFCFIYFIAMIKVVMPSLANEGSTYAHINYYSSLGSSFPEYIKTILTKPKYVFTLFFENHSGNPIYFGIKSELHFVILLSGGIALLYRPQFLVMLLPIYMQKLFNAGMVKWGINVHYSIEFAPLLTIALFFWIWSVVKNEKKRKFILSAAALVCFIVSYSHLNDRVSKWHDVPAQDFCSSTHYHQDFNVKKVHEYLKLVPNDVRVCAQGPLVPYLAFRDDIYTFPYLRDAQYVVLLPKGGSYPASRKKILDFIETASKSKAYETIINNEDFALFRRLKYDY